VGGAGDMESLKDIQHKHDQQKLLLQLKRSHQMDALPPPPPYGGVSQSLMWWFIYIVVLISIAITLSR